MPSSTLTSKWQITVPKDVRRKLTLRVGDKLEFVVDGRGGIVLRPQQAGPLERVHGLLRHLARRQPVSLAEMRAAVRRRAARRHSRSKGR